MSEAEKRQPGWYWIRPDDVGDPWETAPWNGREWAFIATRQKSATVAVVGPRIPTPDEPWQCVPTEATPDMLDVQTLGYHTPASKRWRETLAAAPKPQPQGCTLL